MHNYQIEFEPTDTGYSAFSPEVPGVGVAAETREEAERLLHEAIAFHLEPEDSDALVIQNMTTQVVNGSYSPGYAPTYGFTYVTVNASGTVPMPSQGWSSNYAGPQKVSLPDCA